MSYADAPHRDMPIIPFSVEELKGGVITSYRLNPLRAGPVDLLLNENIALRLRHAGSGQFQLHVDLLCASGCWARVESVMLPRQITAGQLPALELDGDYAEAYRAAADADRLHVVRGKPVDGLPEGLECIYRVALGGLQNLRVHLAAESCISMSLGFGRFDLVLVDGCDMEPIKLGCFIGPVG